MNADGGSGSSSSWLACTVELEFTGDEAAELHLHGFAGRFPLEAHAFGGGGGRRHMHSVVLYLEVLPR